MLNALYGPKDVHGRIRIEVRTVPTGSPTAALCVPIRGKRLDPALRLGDPVRIAAQKSEQPLTAHSRVAQRDGGTAKGAKITMGNRKRVVPRSDQASYRPQSRPGGAPFHRCDINWVTIASGELARLVDHFTGIPDHIAPVEAVGDERLTNAGRRSLAGDADPQIPVLGASQRRVERPDFSKDI